MWKWARGLFGALLVVYAIYGIRAVVVPVVCPPPRPPKVVPKPAPIGSPYELEVIRLTNLERNRRGLSSLQPMPEIMKFSRNWSRVQSGSRMHHSRGSGYGENVAVGQETPASVMRAWLNSPGHRRNILSPNYRYIGVGYVNNGRPYWTQNFK
jgi:uncharacterized protein YkwD